MAALRAFGDSHHAPFCACYGVVSVAKLTDGSLLEAVACAIMAGIYSFAARKDMRACRLAAHDQKAS